MLRTLFDCPSCGETPDSNSFPLCSACSGALAPCPPLCRNCLSPRCLAQGPECSRPWIAPLSEFGIRSFSARYLLIGPGYRVLRRWKTRHGPLFDRWVLNSDAAIRASWADARPDLIAPMPQSWTRAWRLGGSPAAKIADWVGREMRVPVAAGLLSSRPRQGKRQAELGREARLQSRIEFSADSMAFHGKRVLLVDDFMTTGRTLKAAAAALAATGAAEVHAFCLGIRPALSEDYETTGAAGADSAEAFSATLSAG